MAKLSGNYEVVFILNPNLDEEATAAMVAKFKTLVEQNGTLAEVEEWGKRHLAYPINDLTEGYYVLMTFNAKPEFPRELDRILRITRSWSRPSTTAIRPLVKKRETNSAV